MSIDEGHARQVVVVTGAHHGVGHSTCLDYAARGAHLALLGKDVGKLDGVRREVLAAGGTASLYEVDLADPGAVEHVAEQVEEEVGPIAVWVNAAVELAEAAASSRAEMKRLAETTYLDTVYGTMSALKHMRERNEGAILQTGALPVSQNEHVQSAYEAARQRILRFTDVIRAELARDRLSIELKVLDSEVPATLEPATPKALNTRLPRLGYLAGLAPLAAPPAGPGKREERKLANR